jgi:hypothetical protein
MVYDTDLELLLRVTERNIQDASGDCIVTIGRGDTDAIGPYLLERRQPTGTLSSAHQRGRVGTIRF